MRTQSDKEATTLQPFTIKEAVVGLSFKESDEPILAFLNLFGKPIPFRNLSFVHILPNPLGWTLRPGEKVDDKVLEFQKEAMESLREKVGQGLRLENLDDIQYFVAEGSPLEEMLSLAEERDADMLVIGKRAGAGEHGILAKNLIRQSETNVMVIPEEAPQKWQPILVPVDFSENSVRALKTALALKEQAQSDARVIAINIYQRPNLMAFELDMTPERFERNIQENHRRGFEKFMEEHLPEYKDEIEPLLIQNDAPSVARHILDNARKQGAGMIVIGSKGHSRLALMLLGSTTESLLNANEEFPVMVVQ